MTTFWDNLSLPAALGCETAASSEILPDFERPDAAGRASSGRTNGGPASARRVEAAEADPYLAPALRAAAAARARTARIRSGQAQRQASIALQRAPEPPAQRLPPRPADPKPQPSRVETATTAVAPAPRGLSVAAAARATTVAFRPLPRNPEALARAWSPAAPASSAGAATAAPEPAASRTAPEPEPRQQRFARTIAAVERSQAAARARAPRAVDDQPPFGIVPRPALRRPDAAAAGSPWSRLRSLRKDAATE
jgi:hypothetical protein